MVARVPNNINTILVISYSSNSIITKFFMFCLLHYFVIAVQGMFGFLIGTVLVVLRCYYLIVYLLYIRDVKCSVQSDHVRGFIVNFIKK